MADADADADADAMLHLQSCTACILSIRATHVGSVAAAWQTKVC